jgi:hypothetical protein
MKQVYLGVSGVVSLDPAKASRYNALLKILGVEGMLEQFERFIDNNELADLITQIEDNLSIQLKDTDYVIYDKANDHVVKFWTGDVAIFGSYDEAMEDCRGNETVVRCTDLPRHWQEKILTQIQKSK